MPRPTDGGEDLATDDAHAPDLDASHRDAPRRASGQLEAEVLAVLWAAAGPLSPSQVQRQLGGLAYNTVHTILTRLCEKGEVARVNVAGRRAYTPVRDAAQTAARRMRDALDATSDTGTVLASFVSTLSPDEEAALRAALARTRRARTEG